MKRIIVTLAVVSGLAFSGNASASSIIECGHFVPTGVGGANWTGY